MRILKKKKNINKIILKQIISSFGFKTITYSVTLLNRYHFVKVTE